MKKRVLSAFVCVGVVLACLCFFPGQVDAAQSKGVALLVGLTSVDPSTHGGWDGTSGCGGCELDVDRMSNILTPLGYQVNTLKTAQATRSAVLNKIQTLKATLQPGDIFVFYYSGHGAQTTDLNGDESDGNDECLVTYDMDIIDDDLNAIWTTFPAGVRIVMVSDSCHSGTVYKNTDVGFKLDLDEKAMQAELIHIGGCRDNQYSYGNLNGGVFTIALDDVWNGGAFTGNYSQFRDEIYSIVSGYQTPSYEEYNAGEGFRNQKPFTIASPYKITYQRMGLQTTTAVGQTNDAFTFVLGSGNDLYMIKKNGTGSGKTELHMMTAVSNYKRFGIQVATAIHQTDDNFEFLLDAQNNLYIIKKAGTGSGKTEVFALSAASRYQKFTIMTSTALPQTDDTFAFAMGPNRDIFTFKMSGTGSGKTEIHVLSAANGYKKFTLQVASAIHQTDDNFVFLVDSVNDVYIIKKSGTGSGTTEVFVLSAASRYQRFTLMTGTALPQTNDSFEFQLAANRDIFAIKKNGTGSGKTEVHVVLY